LFFHPLPLFSLFLSPPPLLAEGWRPWHGNCAHRVATTANATRRATTSDKHKQLPRTLLFELLCQFQLDLAGLRIDLVLYLPLFHVDLGIVELHPAGDTSIGVSGA
jgi:hypothetical protein